MIKQITICLVFFLALGFTQAQAQEYIFGISYEVRTEEPTGGFGLHFQNDREIIEDKFDLGIRFQVSFYNEEYSDITTIDGQQVNVLRDDSVYDFGISFIGTLKFGMFAPYFGAGLGYEWFDRETSPEEDIPDNDLETSASDNGLFYFGALGVGFSPVPFLRPYVEFRYRGVTTTDFMPDQYGTWAFGVQLRF